MKENLLRKRFWGGHPLFKGLLVAIATLVFLATSDIAFPQSASAYPFWAQQNYENPREATGRIVCANCHLAAKPTKLEVPQSVLPDTVFKAVVEIPYKDGTEQLLGDGSKGGLNVGAVVVLPDGYELAPADRIPEDIQEETEGVFYQKYSDERDNIILVGPLPGDEHREIVFPVLSPDPATNKSVPFGKSLIYAGGNRGRGQVYPTGEVSNNNPVVAIAAGTVSDISEADGGYSITIQPEEGSAVVSPIPAGLDLAVSEGDTIEVGTLLTDDPNVGGFGQADAEIVLQSSARIKGLLAFFFAAMLTQIMLVLKKKQVEKVQAAEML